MQFIVDQNIINVACDCINNYYNIFLQFGLEKSQVSWLLWSNSRTMCQIDYK